MKKIRRAVSIVILSFLIITLTSKTYQAMDLNPPDEAKGEILKFMGNLPAFFIENQGQLPDEVGYYFKGKDNLYFANQGVTFQKVVMESNPPQADVAGNSLESGDHVAGNPSAQTLAYKLEFTGANPTAPIAKSELEGKVNYLIGNDPSRWHTDIPTYQEIVYPGVYGGPESVPARHSERSEESDTNGFIDLVYKGVPGGMKYEFIVHPGANPDDIRLAYTGIEGLSLDDTGNLIIHTALGDVKDDRPYTYQEIDGKQVEVSASFRLNPSPLSPVILSEAKNLGAETLRHAQGDKHPEIPNPQFVYGFELGNYDPRYPLVIDPGLSYSTFLGGSVGDGDFDRGNGIAVDSLGNAYVTGATYTTDFPTTFGAYDTGFNGYYDVFVAKLNPTGSDLLYSTFLGGSNWDEAYGIAVESVDSSGGNGNAYVTGKTSSTNFPTTPVAYDTSHNGGDNAFVTKLSLSGSALVYSTFLGGGSIGRGIAVDASGNAFVTGATYSSNFPITPGAFDTSFNNGYGEWDAFVTKLNPTGSALSYSTFLGGSSRDQAYAIALDASGNAYVTGTIHAYSTDFPTTPGAYDTSLNGGQYYDVFVTKLNPAGGGNSDLVYSTFLGGSDNDYGYGIAVDASGNAFVTGTTYNSTTDFPTTPGAYDTSHNGGYDVFVTKLDPYGSALVYSTFLGGGSTYDVGNGIAVDASGNAFVTGWTGPGSYFPTTPGAFDTTINGNRDAFVTKLDPTGSALVYSTYLGGYDTDNGYAIAVDSSGNAYVTGKTLAADFPTTPGAYDTSHSGWDAFVAKFSFSP